MNASIPSEACAEIAKRAIASRQTEQSSATCAGRERAERRRGAPALAG